MWGTSSHSNSSNRSPTTTPTSNGLYPSESTHMKLSNQIVISPSEQHQQHSHHNSTPSSGHMKWSEGGGAGSGNGSSTSAGSASAKEIPVSAGVYQIHSHPSETASAAVDASMYAHVAHSPHLSHHSSSSSSAAAAAASSGGHIVSPEHHSSATPSQSHPHVSQQTIDSSCEVWSPAYSQYQYFTYHPAPQHANTQ